LKAKYKKNKKRKVLLKTLIMQDYVFENIVILINKYKMVCREVDENIKNELIRTCLENNHDFLMISQLNLVTYAGTI
jgi:hypothetical protein